MALWALAMATINDRLLDEAVDHAIDLTRYSTSVVRRLIATLNRADARLTAALTEALLQLDRESFTVQRLESLLQSVRGINADAYGLLLKELTSELSEYAGYEAAYQTQAMRGTVPSAVQLFFPVQAVSPAQVYAAAMSRPFQGRLLKEWAANLEESRLTLIRNAVRSGYVEGQTTADIVRKIRGTKALNYADGLLDRSRREVDSVVRTALSHTAQTARQAMTDASADLIKAVRWHSTLDSRTSATCRVRDGLQYTADKKHTPIGHKVPWGDGPGRIHFCCRSISVPVLKSWRELGLDIDDMPPGTRASMDGQVPADMTYGQWLGKQSAARQDEILGPERARLLRDGKATFDKFTDDRGKWLTLDQLRKRLWL